MWLSFPILECTFYGMHIKVMNGWIAVGHGLQMRAHFHGFTKGFMDLQRMSPKMVFWSSIFLNEGLGTSTTLKRTQYGREVMRLTCKDASCCKRG